MVDLSAEPCLTGGIPLQIEIYSVAAAHGGNCSQGLGDRHARPFAPCRVAGTDMQP